jgi:hypothetical protein
MSRVRKTMKRGYGVSRVRARRTRRRTTYKESDFSSGDGMLTRVWGPSMWHTLHTISFNYPTKPTSAQKRQYMRFILNLQNVLPCGKCRKNLIKNFKTLPITMRVMTSRDTFSRYIYDLHELVNDMLSKSSGLTYDMVRERYEHFRARCTTEENKIVTLNRTRKSSRSKEKGCTEPMYGKKSKCVMKIVPDDERVKTFHVNKSCERGRK